MSVPGVQTVICGDRRTALHACMVCRRVEGSTGVGRFGVPDGISDHVPLGPVTRCKTCNELRCPECVERCCDG